MYALSQVHARHHQFCDNCNKGGKYSCIRAEGRNNVQLRGGESVSGMTS